jgi:ubiquitin carboxyl-terminal hydrolase 14
MADLGTNIHGNYELSAVLTHIGRSADAGHYMAWTRDKEGSDDWWKFDGALYSILLSDQMIR